MEPRKFVIVERVQEATTPPTPWKREEPEIRMIATPAWFEHRHQIVAAEKAERKARIAENVKNVVCGIVLLVLLFGSCWLLGGY